MTFLKKYLFTFLWLLAMCYLLFSPSGGLPKTGFFHIPHLDKIVHWGMFGILTLVFMSDTHKNEVSLKRSIGILMLLSSAFAVLSELIQYSFIPGRQGSFLDFLADIVGVIMGIAFVLLLRRYTNKKP